jgi:hypothetical protein
MIKRHIGIRTMGSNVKEIDKKVDWVGASEGHGQAVGKDI